MVKGLDLFREHFRSYADRYVLIGGAACELALGEAGLDFRATKDLDIVLCLEAIDSKSIKKHKNDVFRLYQILSPDFIGEIPDSIKDDLRKFISRMEMEEIDLKAMVDLRLLISEGATNRLVYRMKETD